MSKKYNPEDIILKISELLEPSGWRNILKSFLVSQDMIDIIQKLIYKVGDGERFTPPLKTAFRAFQLCPWDSLKIVIVDDGAIAGIDPETNTPYADGLALSGKRGYEPLQKLTFDERHLRGLKDLSHWSEQGVLLLNESLTVGLDELDYHYDIWRPFIAFTLDTISSKKKMQLDFLFLNDSQFDCPHLISSYHRSYEVNTNAFTRDEEDKLLAFTQNVRAIKSWSPN